MAKVALEADPHPCLEIPGLPLGWDPAGEEGPGWYLLYGAIDGQCARRIYHCPFCGAPLRSRTEAEEQEAPDEPAVIFPRSGSSR
jgi:hypothetical protein